jgi:3-hydroxyacyl-CoA dehydrogenase
MPDLVTLTQHGAIGLLTLNNPPVNALSHALRVELCDRLAAALMIPEIRAIVLWCEGRTFVAGADIREFGKTPQQPDVPDVVEFFDKAEKPVVAALHGTSLGGGLELALACHYRLAAAATKLGFPEVSLGILPGAGGTQRLPRLVGVRAALELIVGGAPVGAARALSIGLIDAIVHGDLKAETMAFAERLVLENRPARRVSTLEAVLDEPALLETFEATVRESARGLLAPLHCVRAIRAAVELPFEEGLQLERALFAELMRSTQAAALRHVFFAEREVAKTPGLPQDTPVRPIKHAAVVGAGMRGTSLAISLADARIPVKLVDVSEERLSGGIDAVRRHYETAVAAGRLERAEMEARLGRVQPTLAYDDVKNADLVLEAVPEQLDVKREVFRALDAVCKPEAVLATTSADLDVDELARATRRPDDVLAMHFSNPIRERRVVEVARGRSTGAVAWASALGAGRTLGKIAVSVGLHPGLVAERMRRRAFREALALLEDGALPEQVDGALEEFGFRVGPFGAEPNAAKLVSEHSSALRPARDVLGAQEILERYLYALIDEGARILEENLAARPLDIDVIWVHGGGFPAHRGGPLFYADERGLGHICRSMLEFERRFAAERWSPSGLLAKLAADGAGFYSAPRPAPRA